MPIFSALLFTTRVSDRHYGQQREKTHEMIGVVGNNLELFSSVVEPVPQLAETFGGSQSWSQYMKFRLRLPAPGLTKEVYKNNNSY
jgi:hypothetical protein